MTPRVSIVIPALNEEKYLPLLLEDLAQQTEQHFEVLVVDGNSDDKTKEKALGFSKRLHLRVIDSDKRNLSYQRNLGAAHAHGDYLFFFDADFRAAPDMLKKIGEHLDKEKKLLYLPYPKPGKPSLLYTMQFAVGIKAVLLMDKLGTAYAIGPAIIIKKDFFEKLKGFDEEAYVSEDQNLVIKARKAGERATFLSDVTYLFSMRRFESENKFLLMGKYTIFTIITLLKGAVYTKSIRYQMGGKTSYKTPKI